MTAPLIVITAAVLCAVLSRIIYALNERTLQEARNRAKRMTEKCDEMAQLIQEIDDTNDALAENLTKLSASYGVSCEDMAQNMSKNMNRTLTPESSEGKTVIASAEQIRQLNCPNCGAPVRGSECEYCGTVFSVGNDVDVALDADAVASAARRYSDSAERTIRHFNLKTHQWEWVAENPAKGVSTPALPTKHGRG